MSTVLLDDQAVQPQAEDEATAQIRIDVILELVEGAITFQPVAETNMYSVTGKTINLIGSGGSPREFVITFTLSPSMADYTFFNPAIKLFQDDRGKAGLRFSPDTEVTVQITLFNTMDKSDSQVQDTFNLLLLKDGKTIVHDPTILWDPPGGGV